MTIVRFYEKPGCINNSRQKALLIASGHQVEARNLLKEPWTAQRLRLFFGQRPITEWFNPSAPAIRDGLIDARALDATEALELMTQDPLLIRRPLLEADGRHLAGFDPVAIDLWIGLVGTGAQIDLETCPKSALASPCPAPGVSA